MKLHDILIAVLLVILATCGKLPIQAHSFNDLDYITNLISRGIDYYKLDISMANRKSCQNFSTWNKSKPCYKTSQYIEEICCLALRGDASSRPSFGYNFNTSDELAKFFDSTLAKIVAFQPKRKLLFAINFQYHHSFDDFITQNFLSMLADIMAKYPHNLLLGTGSDSFILEYDRICYGKGAPQCNDMRRKISKSNLFLQSGGMNPFDPRDYYKRFRNFNIYYKGIENYCLHGFPDWINNYPQFPLIFWEPSNEKQIQFVLNYFLSPSCMKKHGRNLTGMAMATNIDPQMFDIYLKKLIEPASLVSNKLGISSLPVLQNISWSIGLQKLLIAQQINTRLTVIKSGQTETIFSVSSNLFTKRVLLQRWGYEAKNESLYLTGSRQYGGIIGDKQEIKYLLQDGIGHVVLITTIPNASRDSANRIYYINSNNMEIASFKEWPKIQTAFMKGNQLIYVVCDDQSVSCSIKGAIQFKQTKTYATFQIKNFLIKVSSIEYYQQKFILVGNSVATKDLSVAVVIENGQPRPPIPLSLGQNPKIFRKAVGKEYGVLLQNSMCHSALLINNNDMNKCNFFQSPQFSSLRNVRNLVNLLQFNMSELLKNDQIVSPCHKSIFLTKLMNGGNSDIVQISSAGSYLISTDYVRIQDQDLVSALFCGGSNYDKVYRYRQKSTMLTTMLLSNVNYIKIKQQDDHEQKLQTM